MIHVLCISYMKTKIKMYVLYLILCGVYDLHVD